ncbi:MAG: hypothetical protein Q4F21_00705 [Lachnospiraceae bacterium]|nr:hypothetical protein [Lachnospiraceae bacterium]
MHKDKETKNQGQLPLLIHKTKYLIDPETAELLKKGIVPEPLLKQITQTQGDEFCFEFRRKIRLIKRICDQIDAGEQPDSIRPLVESGEVPADILYKICHHKLLGKSERLLKAGLLTSDIVEVVRKHLLTKEIIPALSHAFLMDMARYLYEHKEINLATLKGAENGTIDPVYIQIIRRHYRHMTHMEEIQDKHSAFKTDGVTEPAAEDKGLDSRLLQESNLSALKEAMYWLSAEETHLICRIYMDEIPITRIALEYGVAESTIRYRRDRILKKLRFIFENVLHCEKVNLFES